MNLEYFIAKRLITARDHKSSISAPIIKIAIAAIAIGMIMMIISVATGIGLQQKIRQKVAAFNGHIIITNYDENQSQLSLTPISTHQDFYPKFKNVEGINHIQAVATKSGIIRTETAFEGIIFKGVGKDYQWENLKEYLINNVQDINLFPSAIFPAYKSILTLLENHQINYDKINKNIIKLKNMKKLLFIAFLFVALLQSTGASAQDILKGQDLSTLKVDYLSDADVTKIRTQLESNKLTIEQAEQMALAKGMPANEFAKLKKLLTAETVELIDSGLLLLSSIGDPVLFDALIEGVGLVELEVQSELIPNKLFTGTKKLQPLYNYAITGILKLSDSQSVICNSLKGSIKKLRIDLPLLGHLDGLPNLEKLILI